MGFTPLNFEHVRAARMRVKRRACILMAVILPLAAGPLHAADEPSETDALTTAKQQIDRLRADANAAKAATDPGASPQIAPPQLHTAEPADSAPMLIAPVVPGNATRSASGNWLVDAMAKPARTSDPRRAATGEVNPRSRTAVAGDKRDAEADPRDGDQRAEDRSAPQRAAADSTSRTPKDAVFNPLSGYMSAWLAPQDYALLRRTMDNASSGADRSAGAPPPDGAAADTSLQTALAGLGLGAESAGRAPAGSEKASSNPYLEELTAPLPTSPAATAPAAPASLFPPPAALQAPPSEAPAAKPVIPDFVKPTTDEKYFKPLNRF